MKRWKKYFDVFAILSVVFLLCLGMDITVYADGITEDGIEYEVNDTEDGIIITGYSGNGGVLTIPSVLEELPVVEIGEWAFDPVGRDLTEIILPEGMIRIGDWAFVNCTSLTEIKIPGSVTHIGRAAFASCWNLTNVIVDSSNRYYCSQDGMIFNKEKTELICAYDYKKSIVTVPEGVTSIGDDGFSNSGKATEIILPEGIISIGNQAFFGCMYLTKMILPKGLISIGEQAFRGCFELTSVSIPDSVRYMGDSLLGDFMIEPKGAVDIYYEGTEEDWKNIENSDSVCRTYNYQEDRIHFNSTLQNTMCASGHTWGEWKAEWKVTKTSPCKAEILRRMCSVCETEQEKITGNIDHHYITTINKNDEIVSKCSTCGYLKSMAYGMLKDSRVNNVRAVSAGYDSNIIKWDKDSSISNEYVSKYETGYEVYRSTSEKGTYELIAILNHDTVKFTDKNLKSGVKYYYTVMLYLNGGCVHECSKCSKIVSATPSIAKPSITSVKNTDSKKITIKWKKVKGADGYQIYRSTLKKGKYRKAKTITSGSKVSYTNQKLRKGRKYYYKIRAYVKVKGDKVYGNFSKIKSCKVKK